jgi:TPR repeat protein
MTPKGGTEPDMPRAMTLYREACTAGEPRACLAMGRATGSGGVEVMYAPERAVAYFKSACDGGIADGCGELAITMAEGLGTTKDEAAARILASRACEAGSSNGCAGLGVLADDGLGGALDPSAAVAAFERACTLGGRLESAWSCARVAYAHATGRGVPRDVKKSVTLYERACTTVLVGQRPPPEWPGVACVAIALIFEVGYGFIGQKNEPLALALYNYLCDAGNGQAFVARGVYFERHGKATEARADFQRACKKGVKDVCGRGAPR